MTTTTAGLGRRRRQVLVGIDGSVSAQAALTWAAREASYRRRPLHIVHAISWPVGGDPFGLDLTTPVHDGLRVTAEVILGEAEYQARQVAPDIRVTAELFVAGAVSTLLNQAQNADLVVVGSRGLGGFRGLLMGSVSSTVAAHAPCPVIVVHPHRDGTAFPTAPIGRIVVGVDGSGFSTAAIRFAVQEAAQRRVGITAVYAAPPNRGYPSPQVPAAIIEQITAQVVAEAMARQQILVPGIDVKTELVHRHPVQALLDQADGAELVVVGSRGRGGFTGMLLGSVSQAVLHHAGCPVAVVHPNRSQATERSSPVHLSLRRFAAPDRFAEHKELT
jgi:nucleotide-binding universal stress UspA family protein